LVSISEVAKLVRKNRSTIYRDIEKGRLSKTISPDGDTQIDTSELLRAYGRLQGAVDGQSRDQVRIALPEEKTRSLERVLALEAELRKVKDQVTTELRARLADKENVIKVLESKLRFLEYGKRMEQAPDAKTANSTDTGQDKKKGERATPAKGWWARLLRKD
ncbi:MAG: hypothetical protein ACREX0_11930, partial [Noviherbaspirillum sp.]